MGLRGTACSPTQLTQINSALSQPGYPDTTIQLQIQITNTGGSLWAPGASAVSSNLWYSTTGSEAVAADIVLASGENRWFSVFSGGEFHWPGNVVFEPQPADSSANVFIPSTMIGVLSNSDNFEFVVDVQNTDPSNGGDPVSFTLQGAVYVSQPVGGANSIALYPQQSFTTGVAYGTGWPRNVLVQPQPLAPLEMLFAYQQIGVMQDDSGTYWFYSEVTNPQPNWAYIFALQSSIS